MVISDEIMGLYEVLLTNGSKRALVSIESVTDRKIYFIHSLTSVLEGEWLSLNNEKEKLLSINLNDICRVKNSMGINTNDLKIECKDCAYRIYINENIKSDKLICYH